MDTSSNYPWEIRDVEPELTNELAKYFNNASFGYVRVGPKGYFLPAIFKKDAVEIYNMSLRSSDVFVAGYPRSGTTRTRELVWIVANDWNYAEASMVLLSERFIFLDFSVKLSQPKHDTTVEEIQCGPQTGIRRVVQMQSPRFLVTHLALSLLPPLLVDTAKLVYVARDPRDVVVSFYHLNRLHQQLGYNGDFKTFWNLFISNTIIWTPYFEQLKEAWEKRHHPNMLFLYYEEMSKDMPSVIRRVASFLNKACNEEQVTRLSQHLSIDSFKNNDSVNMNELGVINPKEQPFIRKGKIGGWRDYFDEEMTQQAEQWIADNLRDTDLHFPHMTL